MFFLVVWHQESLVLVPLPISVVMQIIPHEQNPQHLREMAGSGFLMFIVPTLLVAEFYTFCTLHT
jgi:hypothetical protein